MSAAYCDPHLAGRHGLLAHARASRFVQGGQARVHRGESMASTPPLERPRVVVLDGGGEEPEGGEHPGRLRHEHLAHADLLGQRDAVHGSRRRRGRPG